MQTHKINKGNIKDYILPEMENLKALLNALNLTQSLAALAVLECVLAYELNIKNETH